MAEFRKREDITQEIDLLQQWSDLGAPRMSELASNLKHLVKTVDPTMASKIEIRTAQATPGEAPVPSEVPGRPRDGQARPLASDEDLGWPPGAPPPPPEFADLPPGDDERTSRGAWLPLLGALLLLGAAAALWWTRDEGPPPVASPVPDRSGEASRPPATSHPAALPSALTTAAPSAAATALTPTAAPTAPAAGVVTAAPSGAPAPASAAPVAVVPTPGAAAARRSPLPGLRPVQPVRRTQPRVTEYVVRLGDSLSLIAKRELGEMERWPELHTLNRGQVADPDLILPGQRLSLPGADAPEAPEAAAEVAYTTRPGDTLQGIARAHLGDAGRWREIWELNSETLPAQTVVPPGTVLRLPAAPGAGPLPGAERRPAWKGTGKPRHHVVKHGESLSLLARRYLGATSRWPEIYYLNSHKIAHAHTIYPGQVLAIPPAHGGRALRYVVRSGDTLWAIAATHLNSPFRWPALYRANRALIANPHWIYPGQVFRLPQ